MDGLQDFVVFFCHYWVLGYEERRRIWFQNLPYESAYKQNYLLIWYVFFREEPSVPVEFLHNFSKIITWAAFLGLPVLLNVNSLFYIDIPVYKGGFCLYPYN